MTPLYKPNGTSSNGVERIPVSTDRIVSGTEPLSVSPTTANWLEQVQNATCISRSNSLDSIGTFGGSPNLLASYFIQPPANKAMAMPASTPSTPPSQRGNVNSRHILPPAELYAAVSRPASEHTEHTETLEFEFDFSDDDDEKLSIKAAPPAPYVVTPPSRTWMPRAAVFPAPVPFTNRLARAPATPTRSPPATPTRSPIVSPFDSPAAWSFGTTPTSSQSPVAWSFGTTPPVTPTRSPGSPGSARSAATHHNRIAKCYGKKNSFMGTPSIINIKVATRTGIRILEAHEIDMESESEEEELSKIEEDGPDSSFETCTSMASSATATTKFVFSHSSPTVPGSPSEAQRYAAATRRHMVSMLAEAQAAKEAEEKMEMERKDKELQEAKQVELKDSFRGSLLRKFQLIADEKKKATKEREAAVVVGQLKASGFL